MKHYRATLKERIFRNPPSLGGMHYHLEPGAEVGVKDVTNCIALCYCGQEADSRVSEDYFRVPVSKLNVSFQP